VTEKVNVMLPINTPPRSELWQRCQLAKSILSHRPCSAETTQLLLAILDGTVPDGSVTSGS
jgi:hypothetical protein